MVKRSRLDVVYGALADPTRRAMVERLQHGPMTVSAIAAPLPMTLAAVGKHITVLETAGLVHTHKRGRVRTCTLVAAPLDDAQEWIERQRMFWTSRLDALTDHLKENP